MPHVKINLSYHMGLNVKTGAYSVQEKTQKEVFAHVDEAEIS